MQPFRHDKVPLCLPPLCTNSISTTCVCFPFAGRTKIDHDDLNITSAQIYLKGLRHKSPSEHLCFHIHTQFGVASQNKGVFVLLLLLLRVRPLNFSQPCWLKVFLLLRLRMRFIIGEKELCSMPTGTITAYLFAQRHPISLHPVMGHRILWFGTQPPPPKTKRTCSASLPAKDFRKYPPAQWECPRIPARNSLLQRAALTSSNESRRRKTNALLQPSP